MNTSVIFVEILIIGLQTVIGVSIILVKVLNIDIPPLLDQYKDWTNIILFLAIGLSYIIGIIVDRISDLLFIALNPVNCIEKITFIKKKFKSTHEDEKMFVFSCEQQAASFLNYSRSRMRIMRAVLFNTLLFLPAAVIIYIVYSTTFPSCQFWFFLCVIIAGGTVCWLIFFIILGLLQYTYENRLTQTVLYLREEKKGKVKK